jgi:filamentous hemagglutinin
LISNRGFDGPPVQETLPVGAKLDRFGGNGGDFFAPKGSSFGERALPPASLSREYKEFEVIRPLPVLSGKAAPWFDQPGGGIQYTSPNGMASYTVQDLIRDGYIKEVVK